MAMEVPDEQKFNGLRRFHLRLEQYFEVLISSRSSKSYYMELKLKKYFGLYFNFSMTIFRLQGLAET